MSFLGGLGAFPPGNFEKLDIQTCILDQINSVFINFVLDVPWQNHQQRQPSPAVWLNFYAHTLVQAHLIYHSSLWVVSHS